jgi:hypothetical protein
MGIAFSHLPFYDLCRKLGAIQSPLFVLGSQEIHEPEEKIREFALRSGCVGLARDLSVRSLFRERYSVTDYCDCDLNNRADLALDFGKPLPAEFARTAMTVLNSGTIEHIFDVGRAFRNIHELTCVGGVIIHCAPLTWFEHGYFNFNPRLFSEIADANGYRLLAEGFHCVRDVLGGETKPALYITFDGLAVTPLRERIFALLKESVTVSNVLYMAAYRKTSLQEFDCPYEICE